MTAVDRTPAVDPPKPIDVVIGELEQLVAWSMGSPPSRIGFFAGLYLRVTSAIRAKIGTGFFADDARMEALDAAFAGRYLASVRQFRDGDPALASGWGAALAATRRDDLIVVQHLLGAMNPHINLDLAVACAETSPAAAIDALHGDFLQVNAVLAGVLPAVLAEIGDLSPWIHLLDDLAEDGETTVLHFSLDAARDAAWDLARTLAALPVTAREARIAEQNTLVTSLGERIFSPDAVEAAILAVVRRAEVSDVASILQVLNTGNPIAPGGQGLLAAAATATAAKAAMAAMAEPAAAATVASSPAPPTPPNQTYYFKVGAGRWTGAFHFQITSWRRLWSSRMSLKNKLLASAMAAFQKLAGDAAIVSVLTPYPERGAAGLVTNDLLIKRSWLRLLHSAEEYALDPNGTAVRVDARIQFGPIPFLFREHDLYPAAVFAGGMRNLYRIRLLGTRFLGEYEIQPDLVHLHSRLSNDWALAEEVLTKQQAAPGPA